MKAFIFEIQRPTGKARRLKALESYLKPEMVEDLIALDSCQYLYYGWWLRVFKPMKVSVKLQNQAHLRCKCVAGDKSSTIESHHQGLRSE